MDKKTDFDSKVATTLRGKRVMCRTQYAGVFAGVLVELKGDTALLMDARRIYRWEGAATLSQLANTGTASPDKCKFPEPVKHVLLNGVIEMIPITKVALKTINAVPVWAK